MAAILFPVFAQAKEAAKKSAYTSNIKQCGTAAQIYMADYDDCWPLAMGVRPDGTWGVGVAHPVPANSLDPASGTGAIWYTPGRPEMANTIWANSCQPYMKNYGLLQNPNASAVNPFGDVYTSAGKSSLNGIQFNGFLHGYNATAVANVSVVPAFWFVQKLNLTGRNFSSPALNCGSLAGVPDDCRFNPSGKPSAHNGVLGDVAYGMYVSDFTTTVWLYSKKLVVGRCDSSAKVLPVGVVTAPAQAAFPGLNDPWANVTTTGAPGGFWPCDSTLNGQAGYTYPCYFRPDRDH